MELNGQENDGQDLGIPLKRHKGMVLAIDTPKGPD